ncbi:hypothetical protein [Paenibacillus macerans]|uniref:hypothetical protein n=1 Tax=Paenibacillus macerans TaxID=44252 RepID=UPI00203A44F3|nr:hypothetical protein [Paenibacillus macerans]MCM3703711.1 hypothetical protein [Paenibacillus macerans]
MVGFNAGPESGKLALLLLVDCSGVPVLACGPCVNYYGIQDQLVAGEVSSMGRFLELAEQYE